MTDLHEKIDKLTDQQALSVVSSLAAEFAQDETPDTSADQAQVLEMVLQQRGTPIDLSEIESSEAAGDAARDLLLFIAQVPEMQSSLEEWLNSPPTPEQAGLPILLAAPVVFTGCLVLLQVAGHARFRRHVDGKWEFEYDPSSKTPFDATVKMAVQVLSKMMPGSHLLE